MSCGGFVSAKLQKYEVRLLLAKKRRLGAERRCYELARECLLAIRRLDEKIKEMNLPETASASSDKLKLGLRNPRQS